MQEEADKKANDAPAPVKEAPKELPIDTRLLSETVIELNISRKNVSIYPPGHIQITKSIDRAFEILQKLFEIRSEMTLGVAKDTLLVGQDYLDQRNPVYRDFALSMNQQGIAAVTFVRGLDKEQLIRFHRIITTKPEDILSMGGIEKVMQNAAVPNIRVQVIDFGSLHLTEEKEIFKPQAKVVERGSKTREKANLGAAGERAGAGIWQDFVSHLASGTIAGQGQGGISLKDAEQIDPSELARLLNERKLDPGAAIQSYDRIISSHMRGAAEKQLTSEQSSTLASLNSLLKELNPELRKQFLSVAFNRVSDNAQSPFAEEVVGGFTDDMVIEMLGQANAEGRQISPTLAGLVQRLSRARPNAAPPDHASGVGEKSTGGLVLPAMQVEHMQKLFDREAYEQYVSKDYEALLKNLSGEVGAKPKNFLIDDYLKTLEDVHLDFQIGRALVAFMEEKLDEDDYREFANKLITLVPQFLETGNFELLWDISETLRRHSTDKPVKGIRESAIEARKIFLDADFRAKALDAVELWMRDKGPEAAGLILSLGPETIPGLVDIFSKDESVGGRRVVFNLLCQFGDKAVLEARTRLHDPRTYFVRNLLMLIRRVGTPSSIPHVKQLLGHKDQSVRMEALSTLLKFKEPAAIKLLREAIGAQDPDVASQAVMLSGQYRVHEVTTDILARIKRVILFEADYTINEEIIRALGEIGDIRAIPDLIKLARSGWTLYPQRQLKMKEILFESLGRFPREAIADLVKVGEQLNSDTIRRACKKLLELQ
jgi:HEAT repeat protein